MHLDLKWLFLRHLPFLPDKEFVQQVESIQKCVERPRAIERSPPADKSAHTIWVVSIGDHEPNECLSRQLRQSGRHVLVLFVDTGQKLIEGAVQLVADRRFGVVFDLQLVEGC